MFTVLDEDKEKEEIAVQQKINKLIDQNKSLVFKAGAGSGKTYALIESLKHLINKEGTTLRRHNQKVVVITFTNIAADEIKARLGNSQLILVSTIHERLWNIISTYQKELVEIHLEKLNNEIIQLDEKIELEDRFMDLSDDQKDEFIQVMMQEDSKNIFYQNYDEKAAKAKIEYEKINFSFNLTDTDLLKNVGKFKTLVNNLYRKNKYQNAVKNIRDEMQGYDFLEYNTRQNRDRLDNMEISHDSLLEYGLKLIQNYPLLRQIIINTYPYFIIDEYQDTSCTVVDVMHTLDNYAEKIKHNFFVGYFGDEMQSIYSGGVGDKLETIHLGLQQVVKYFNRRSSNEVIDIINKVRSDELKQTSIYKDGDGGSVNFYVGRRENAYSFIQEYKDKWQIDVENPLDVLVLTNQSVANYVGITNLYNTIRESNHYTENLRYDQLNQELLSKNKDRLGDVQKSLYELFHIIYLFEQNHSTVSNILSVNDIKEGISLKELNELINHFKNIQGNTLSEILDEIERESILEMENLSDINDARFTNYMNRSMMLNVEGTFKKDAYKQFLLKNLGNLEDAIDDQQVDEKIENANNTLQSLLAISKEEFLKWYSYLIESGEQEVRYHTYHGTKGLEFENVIIIMEHNFGRSSYFDHYFKYRITKESLSETESKRFKAAEKLLYVATSRAIKNLRIMYVDEINDIYNGIESVFGEPLSYPEK